jgi:hypothetical protein
MITEGRCDVNPYSPEIGAPISLFRVLHQEHGLFEREFC